MTPEKKITRRRFLGSAAAAAAFTVVPRHVLGGPGHIAPSDKINLGYIGLGTQGLRELTGLLPNPEVHIAAVCDPNTDSTDYVDWSRHGLRNQIRKFLDNQAWGEGVDGIRAGREVGREIVEAYYAGNKPSNSYRGCASYADFRELLEKEKDLDAVKIMTPDHLHATIAIAAMKKGKHVVMHKPVANVLYEARLAVETARETQVATHLSAWSNRNSIALVRAWIEDGSIGPLREVHNWINKPIWPQWPACPTETPPVPEGFDWDLWLGPALDRPYHPNYTHAVFRGWYDFGSGILGDMGIYSLWPVFTAFGLEAPVRVEATPSFTCEIVDQVSGIKENKVSFPNASTIRFTFAGHDNTPQPEIFWYDGGMRPPTPEELYADNKEMPASGMMFVGDRGKILADFLGNRPQLIPEQKMREHQGAEEAAREREDRNSAWIAAFKGGEPSPGSFESVKACTEAICLGAVALRVGRKIEWDAASMKITNLPEANELLYRKYREGWEL
ncbi:MAG: Gfo/Idh/MocA family oxidoreductase [Candidatus Glassbacteria bacterium]|nr:Gfo/Idh/MocA family oxidoreductase [Candidatus Glassbacteria bacterium]